MKRIAPILALTLLFVLPLQAYSQVSPRRGDSVISTGDLTTRAAPREPAIEQPLGRMGRFEGTSAPILFAEPPMVDSLPRVAGHLNLPDSLYVGMSDIAVSDLDGDGLPEVVGVEFRDSTLVIRRNMGGGFYGSGERYALAWGAYWLALADFDGDGHPDVGVGNFAEPYTSPLPHAYSTLHNRGDGTFDARVDGSLTALPIRMHAVDLGHDGHADLIFPLFNHASVDIVRSRADGSFEPTFNLSASRETYYETSADVGDVDGDSNPDIVILYNKGDCYGPGGACLTLAVFYGMADGTFEAPLNYQAYDPDGPHGAESVWLQDVDGDRQLDVVVRVRPKLGGSGPAEGPAVIHNAGARRLDAPFVQDLLLAPVALAPGRFMRGAPEDLVFSDANGVSIMRGRGDGTFGPIVGVARGALGAVADLDGDALSDIIVSRKDTTEIWTSDGTGGFHRPTVITAGRFLAVANFAGDHLDGPPESKRWHNSGGHRRASDLAVVMPSGHIGILPGDGRGRFGLPVDFGPADGMSLPLQAVDLDDDGRADLAFTRAGLEDSLVVKWNLGVGFSVPSLFDLGSSNLSGSEIYASRTLLTDLKVGDFNGDGLPDLAVVKGTGGSGSAGAVAIVLNQGYRAFGPPSPVVLAGEDANQAAIADFDGDGSDDIAVVAMATDFTGRYSVFKPVGNELRRMPNVSRFGGYAVEHFATCGAAADFNGDGRVDLAIGCGYTYGGLPGAILIPPNISPAAPMTHVPVKGQVEARVSAAFTLDGARPNPAPAGRITVAFALPSAAPAQIEVIDIAGRRVAEREVGPLGPGRHLVDVAEGRRLAPGIYLVRLRQGAGVRTARVAILD